MSAVIVLLWFASVLTSLAGDAHGNIDVKATKQIAVIIQHLFNPDSIPNSEDVDPILAMAIGTQNTSIDDKTNFEAWVRISTNILNMASAEWQPFAEKTRKLTIDSYGTQHRVTMTMIPTWRGVEWHPAFPADVIHSPNGILRIKFETGYSVEDARRMMILTEPVQRWVPSRPFTAGDELLQVDHIFVIRVGTTVVSIVSEPWCSEDQLMKFLHTLLGPYY